MATDGVKIIDSDIAHDTYGGILDLYDQHVGIKDISASFPFVRSHYSAEADDFYYELFVTSYALAFWEIGELTAEILAEVKTVIEVGAGVKLWLQESGPKDSIARQKELAKFWLKISQPNTKIRKRRKYKIITHFHFEVDSLLAFKLDDSSYRALICSNLYNDRGKCYYHFVPTSFKGIAKPTLNEVLNCDIIGTSINNDYSREYLEAMQPGIDQLWALYPECGNFMEGLCMTSIEHKDLSTFKDKFEVIGKLMIKPGFKRFGSQGATGNFDGYCNSFLYKTGVNSRTKRYPAKILCYTEEEK